MVLDSDLVRFTTQFLEKYGALADVHSDPYIKKAGFDAAIAQDLSLVNGKFQVGVRAETRTSYMVITSRYVSLQTALKSLQHRESEQELAAVYRQYAQKALSGCHQYA